MSLTKSTEDLRNAQSLAAELAKSAGSALETIEALALELKDKKKQAALLSEALRHLIGDPKTEDEIADTVPGGNGGVFKSKETLAKGHGISDRGSFAQSDMSGGEHEGYVQDQEPEDKEGGAQ